MDPHGRNTEETNPFFTAYCGRFFIQVIQHFHMIRDEADWLKNHILDLLLFNQLLDSITYVWF